MSVAVSIMRGELDDELDQILEAYRSRSRYLREIRNKERSEAIEVGMEVVVTSIRPQYIKGVRGIVQKIDSARAHVLIRDVDKHRCGRYLRPDGTLNVPTSSIEPVA